MTLLALLAIVLAFPSAAQNKKWFAIHEDLVIPSQDTRYTEALKNLKAACSTHKLNVGWVTVRHDDNSYIHLMPISSFAQLDKDMFEPLKNNVGEAEFGKLMSGFDGCYNTHSDFIVEEMTDHSYMTIPEGENYRDVFFWTVATGKEMEGEKLLAEWKKLYETKKSPDGYLCYKVVFGRAPGFAIVSWGKDQVDAATKNKKSMELIGKDADDLLKRTMAITTQFSSKRAWVLPDYSYTPPAGTVTKK